MVGGEGGGVRGGGGNVRAGKSPLGEISRVGNNIINVLRLGVTPNFDLI